MSNLGLLREKDLEYALLLEEKMGLQLRLLAATGMNPPLPPNPDYGRLVGEHTDTHSVWSEVCQAIKVRTTTIILTLISIDTYIN